MQEIEEILNAYKREELTIEQAAAQIKQGQGGRIEEMGFAALDIDREKRTGFPEVIFGEGKSAEQLTAIFLQMTKHTERVIATRVDSDKADQVMTEIKNVTYHKEARMLTWFRKPILKVHNGYAAVVSAGSSDGFAAEEAAITAESMGSHVERVYDVGVAGIHRLFRKLPLIREANVVVVTAGMEGALASVVAGLVDKPVIALPTSVGYGANLQGISAMLGMLNSCAPGVSVVNIDNGFGAGYLAGMINKNSIKG